MLGLMLGLICKNHLPARIRGWAGTDTGRHIHVIKLKTELKQLKWKSSNWKPTEGLLATLHSKHIFWDSWAKLVFVSTKSSGKIQRRRKMHFDLQKSGFFWVFGCIDLIQLRASLLKFDGAFVLKYLSIMLSINFRCFKDCSNILQKLFKHRSSIVQI